MIRVECDNNVAQIVLSRPEKLNAMDRSFWGDLRSALHWIADQDIRAIIFTGEGERAFSVGGDIASFAELETAGDRRAFQIEAMEAFDAVASSPLPTIAAVSGLALGGGCELAMACDFVLSARSAVFGLPEARFGLVPGYGILAAPAIVGVQMAKLMILTGETLTADEALKFGLTQKVCDDEALNGEALRLARKMAETSPHAITAAKAILGRQIGAEEVAESVEIVSRLHATAESRKAVLLFLEQHRSMKRGER